MKVGNGLKIEGVLGCCANGGVKNASVSDTEMGIGGTCQWKFCSINPRTTIAVLFEIVAQVILHFDSICFLAVTLYLYLFHRNSIPFIEVYLINRKS